MRIRVLILGSLLLGAPIVGAQEVTDEQDDKRFSYRVGAQLFTNFSSSLRIDSETLGRGTEFSVENDLNVEESLQVVRLDGVYRFGRRHAVLASFYDINRTGNRTISRDIEIGEKIFPVNTAVGSSFDQNVFKLAYRYQFLDRPKFDMGASFGLHTIQLKHSVQSDNGSLSQSNTADAPLPVLGIHGSYRFAPKWRFVGSVEWFDVQSGDLQGTFLDAIVSVEHDTFENFGFGFGFNRLELDLAAGDENLRGLIAIKFDAAMFYVKGGFGGR